MGVVQSSALQNEVVLNSALQNEVVESSTPQNEVVESSAPQTEVVQSSKPMKNTRFGDVSVVPITPIIDDEFTPNFAPSIDIIERTDGDGIDNTSTSTRIQTSQNRTPRLRWRRISLTEITDRNRIFPIILPMVRRVLFMKRPL